MQQHNYSFFKNQKENKILTGKSQLTAACQMCAEQSPPAVSTKSLLG